MPRRRKEAPKVSKPVNIDDDTPIFTPAVVASLLGIDQRKLRAYEIAGLIHPKRTSKGRRMYSRNDLKRLEVVEMLSSGLGVTQPGIKVIMALMEEIDRSGLDSKEIVRRLIERRQQSQQVA
jgi:MerR family transcriptional regulator/heat shock protein HspR